MAIKKTAKTKPRTDAVNSVGPQGGLAAGVIAGVNTARRTPAPAPNSAITMPPAMTEAFTPKPNPVVPKTSIEQVGPQGGLQAGVVAGVKAPSGYTGTGQPITQPVVTPPVVPADDPYKPTREDIDAFEELGLILKSYGLEGLADTYGRLMAMGKTAGQALTILKYDKTIDPVTGQPYNAAYAKRFAGNAARVAAGMNAYDEGTYLEVENAYEETLRRYGLSNMISPDRSVNQAKFADYMGKGIAPTEFAGRIQSVADDVINADPDVKAQFKTFYPSITDADLVSYFLDPKQTLPVLQTKVRAAEIGGAATSQDLGITEARAMELGKFGVSRKEAVAGFSQVAEALPTGKKLSDIYAEEKIGYTQQVAEDEYLKQDAQAKLKRNRLASKERAMFAGESGVGSGSLTRQTQY
jgi:hypothetical protein